MTGQAVRYHVGLLGYPLGHTLSPLLHNAAFRALGLDGVYLACPVPPDRLDAALAGLVALGFAGANVTIPHKESVRARLEAVSEQAAAVGAVNTLVVRREGEAAWLFGDNTDVAGFLAPLAPWAEALGGAEAVVLGAGGAARAVAYALLTAFRPARLTLVARRPAQAAAVAAHLAGHDPAGALAVAGFAAARLALVRARLVVNTTPVGTAPGVEATPWPDVAAFGPHQLVYDLIYNPSPTRLLREAAARGARTLGGLPMLVEQAAAAFRQWTGRPMPTDAAYAALRARGFS